MADLAKRLTELHRHVEHLRALRPRLGSGETLRGDMSFRNDLLFSLLMVCQIVLDGAGELGVRRGLRFDDYDRAVQSLATSEKLPPRVVTELARLPGLRNLLLYQCGKLDLDRAVETMDRLDAVEELVDRVSSLLIVEP